MYLHGWLISTFNIFEINRFVQVNKMDGFSCSIKITHNLVDRDLISPKVFVNRGSTRTPPPYKITAGYEDADKKFAIFDADDKLTKADFATSGSMSYDIGKTYLLVIVWNVVKHGTFLLGEGKNSFYFAVLKKTDIKTNWKTSLKNLYEDAQTRMIEASTARHYVELVNKAADNSVDFTIRTHMTNDKNAQLTLIIDDPRAVTETTPEKRALATSMGMSALFTVVGSLSKMALRHLPTDTQSVVVTIQNDFTDASLEDPLWNLKQTIVYDSVPFEIPSQEERQITFKIPFGYAQEKNPLAKLENSAIFVSYRIKGSPKRLTFTIWWSKKFEVSNKNHYSVSLFASNIDPGLIQNIVNSKITTGAKIENVLEANSYLDYQCKEEDYEIEQTVNNVKTKVKKIIRTAVAMGDSTATNMVVNIGERKGNKLDRVIRDFQPCYDKL